MDAFSDSWKVWRWPNDARPPVELFAARLRSGGAKP
jgi:hypothetical protein